MATRPHRPEEASHELVEDAASEGQAGKDYSAWPPSDNAHRAQNRGLLERRAAHSTREEEVAGQPPGVSARIKVLIGR